MYIKELESPALQTTQSHEEHGDNDQCHRVKPTIQGYVHLGVADSPNNNIGYINGVESLMQVTEHCKHFFPVLARILMICNFRNLELGL